MPFSQLLFIAFVIGLTAGDLLQYYCIYLTHSHSFIIKANSSKYDHNGEKHQWVLKFIHVCSVIVSNNVVCVWWNVQWKSYVGIWESFSVRMLLKQKKKVCIWMFSKQSKWHWAVFDRFLECNQIHQKFHIFYVHPNWFIEHESHIIPFFLLYIMFSQLTVVKKKI